MAKTIKFNLILDGHPIRDIKGLQEYFCIDDILDLYQKGRLQKWLKVRGFDEYLKNIEAMKEDESTIIQLIQIFDIEKTEKDIMEAIYSLRFWNERKVELEEWNKKDIKIKAIIADYHNGYDVLMAQIIENREDMSFIKIAVKNICDIYLEIFKIDYPFLFAKFKKDVPLMIYAILMNKKLRTLFLNDTFILKEIIYMNEKLFPNIINSNSVDSSSAYNSSGYGINLIWDEELLKIHNFYGETDSYWKDLEFSGTEVMILSMPSDTFIRSANNPREELSADVVNGHFLILDGLLYKSNIKNYPLIYIEL